MTSPPAADDGFFFAPLLRAAGSVFESEIRGRSMAGTLPEGTRIRIRADASLDYPVGTVIAFVGGRGLVAHRLVGRASGRTGEPLLLLRGDGTRVCDTPIEGNRVVGQVIAWSNDDAWVPIPVAPRDSWCGAACAAVVLQTVRSALFLHPRFAARVAAWLMAMERRLPPALGKGTAA